ncbi:hypothetical protein D0Z07_8474 [Hyphodiscus hymeniophilus]|uniref:Uncharacterized protein n=1 Tax=Hyphodiscus hymeniophilus TaxID=353542 RepID=A0A9P6VDA9_9HELO|nr:hypothetical protein D0Z07_8474 [Hyphodiscus hymeniophilus]
MVIRSSPARDDYLKAASRFKDWNPDPDIGHVKEKHGSAKGSTELLLHRLGKAITRRRQFLKYRVEHFEKLSGAWEDDERADEKNDKPEKTMASTKATTFMGNDNIYQKEGSDTAGSFGSQTSYEATILGDEKCAPQTDRTTSSETSVPGHLVPNVKDKAAWKKHVFRDLKPYSEEAVEIISAFACPLCDEWEASIKARQGKQDPHTSMVLKEREAVEPHGTKNQFRRHLGRHMEQLALFALPMSEVDELENNSTDEDDGDASDQSVEGPDETSQPLVHATGTEAISDNSAISQNEGETSEPAAVVASSSSKLQVEGVGRTDPSPASHRAAQATESNDNEDDTVDARIHPSIVGSAPVLHTAVKAPALHRLISGSEVSPGRSQSPIRSVIVRKGPYPRSDEDIDEQDYYLEWPDGNRLSKARARSREWSQGSASSSGTLKNEELQRVRKELESFKLKRVGEEEAKHEPPSTSRLSVAYDRHPEFTAKIAADLQDAGFNPDNVINFVNNSNNTRSTEAGFINGIQPTSGPHAEDFGERLAPHTNADIQLEYELRKELDAVGSEEEARRGKSDTVMERLYKEKKIMHRSRVLAERRAERDKERKKEDDEAIESWKKQQIAKEQRMKEEKEEKEKEYTLRLEEDLRKSGMDEREINLVTKKEAATDAKRPTYTRIARRHLSIETLNWHRIDYELDKDPEYVLIKRRVPEYEQDFLWNHTREIRENRAESRIAESSKGESQLVDDGFGFDPKKAKKKKHKKKDTYVFPVESNPVYRGGDEEGAPGETS